MVVTIQISEQVPNSDRVIEHQCQFLDSQMTSGGAPFVYGEAMRLLAAVREEVKEATGPVTSFTKGGKLFVRRVAR